MKKELGYLLVGFTLITGTLVGSETGNAFTITNKTGGTLHLDEKMKAPITLENGAKSQDLKESVTVAVKNSQEVVEKFLVLDPSKNVEDVTIVIDNGNLVAQ